MYTVFVLNQKFQNSAKARACSVTYYLRRISPQKYTATHRTSHNEERHSIVVRPRVPASQLVLTSAFVDLKTQGHFNVYRPAQGLGRSTNSDRTISRMWPMRWVCSGLDSIGRCCIATHRVIARGVQLAQWIRRPCRYR